jgi:excisionase family DNA binding protein
VSGQLLSLPEVAVALGRPYEWVRVHVNEGEIPAVRVGKRLYVSEDVLRRWLEGDRPVTARRPRVQPVSPKQR